MTLPHPRKGNRAVERRLHMRLCAVLERECLPQWQWADITGCEPKGWPDFLIAGPLRVCFLKLPSSNGQYSKEQADVATRLIAAGYGYGLAHDYDDALSMLRDWGCVP
jgi:hypothetical protein